MPERHGSTRVLWVTTSLQPGGGERNIVSVLPHMERDGVRVALCTLMSTTDGPLGAEFARTGLRRADLGMRRLADPRGLARLVRLLRRERVDLVHSHDQYGNLLAVAAGAIARVPVVMSRHVLDEPARNRRGEVRARLAIAALRDRAARVIAVSEAVKASLVAAGVAPGRVSVVLNGVAQDAFAQPVDRDRVRAALDVPADAPALLVPAVLRPGKGHEVMVDAAAMLRDRLPGLRVLLAGEGPLREEIARRAAGVPGVRLLGHRDDVPALMAACDLVVLPSFAEGLPTVLIEGALAGRPVVSSDVGGAGEIVRQGETGLLVPAGDPVALAGAIAAVLGRPDRGAAMGAAARADARARFALERQGADIRAVYREVLAA